jgi:hypothetical protein
MAWSLPFTSSASSIVEVKDRRTLREVQSYHKSSSLLGERSGVTAEKQGEVCVRTGRKGEIPELSGASLSRCIDQARQTHVIRVWGEAEAEAAGTVD